MLGSSMSRGWWYSPKDSLPKLPPDYILYWSADTEYEFTNYVGAVSLPPGPGTTIGAEHDGTTVYREDWGDGSLAFNNTNYQPPPYLHGKFLNEDDFELANGHSNEYTLLIVARMGIPSNFG